MLAKLSTCNHPLRPYLPNCTECTRYLSSTGRFVNILLGPTKYEEFVMRDNLACFYYLNIYSYISKFKIPDPRSQVNSICPLT